MTPSIAALIFDMDGLLVDTETVAEAALRRFLAEHGHAILPGTMEAVLGRRLPEAVAMVAAAHGLPGPVEEHVMAFDRLRLQALRGNVVAMPGAAELLKWVKRTGLPAAVATSSFRRHANVSLTEAGLSGLFDVEVTGDDVHNGKPAPDLFLLAARRLGVEPARCVVFEDAPAGLEAAAKAGMRRVWIPNGHTQHLVPAVPVDARLEDLSQAVPWLRSMGVGASPRARGI